MSTEEPANQNDTMLAAAGRAYLEDTIASLEEAEPGWLPLFYKTLSFESDIAAADQLRELYGMPRPPKKQLEIEGKLIDHNRRVADFKRKREQHEGNMASSWLYRMKFRLGLIRPEWWL